MYFQSNPPNAAHTQVTGAAGHDLYLSHACCSSGPTWLLLPGPHLDRVTQTLAAVTHQPASAQMCQHCRKTRHGHRITSLAVLFCFLSLLKSLYSWLHHLVWRFNIRCTCATDNKGCSVLLEDEKRLCFTQTEVIKIQYPFVIVVPLCYTVGPSLFLMCR